MARGARGPAAVRAGTLPLQIHGPACRSKAEPRSRPDDLGHDRLREPEPLFLLRTLEPTPPDAEADRVPDAEPAAPPTPRRPRPHWSRRRRSATPARPSAPPSPAQPSPSPRAEPELVTAVGVASPSAYRPRRRAHRRPPPVARRRCRSRLLDRPPSTAPRPTGDDLLAARPTRAPETATASSSATRTVRSSSRSPIRVASRRCATCRPGPTG
jgi:hypothetical protein